MSIPKFALTFSAFGAVLLLCSCNTRPEWEDEWVAQDIVAAPAAQDQIRIDGVISPDEWDDAQAYQLARAKDWGYDGLLPRQRKREDTTPFERGFFKVKYDSEYLYVLGSFDDAEVFQTGRENQLLFSDTGDVIEVFVKPEDKSAVWQFCATPWNNISTRFYPWAGYGDDSQTLVDGVKVAAAVRNPDAGGENEAKAGWDVEMAISRSLIEQAGGVFVPGGEWRILLGRYNGGANLPSRQISSTPRLPRTDHRLTEYYSKLKFKPSADDKPAVEEKPAADEKSAPEDKPAAAGDKPSTDEKTAADAQTVNDKPAEVEKPAAADKPAEVEKPTAADKPAAEEKPTVDEKPTPAVKSAAEPKDAPAEKLAADAKPASATPPTTAEKPAAEAK